MDYLGVWEDDEGTVYAYPEDAPYVMRDQGARNADDTVRVVIGDIADVLRAGNAPADDLARAEDLYAEASELWSFDREDGTSPRSSDSYGWLEGDAGETLRDILETAENLPNVRVEWNADAGTVLTTLADRWETFPSVSEAIGAGVPAYYLSEP